MKLSPRSRSSRNNMRVATVLTGAVALTAAVAPAAEANTPVPQPYKIWVRIDNGTDPYLQVCGYKSVSGVGHWTCTVIQTENGSPPLSAYMGSDWRRGKINVWEWNIFHSNEQGHTCNTNSAYNGHLVTGGVVLTGPGGAVLNATNSGAC